MHSLWLGICIRHQFSRHIASILVRSISHLYDLPGEAGFIEALPMPSRRGSQHQVEGIEHMGCNCYTMTEAIQAHFDLNTHMPMTTRSLSSTGGFKFHKSIEIREKKQCHDPKSPVARILVRTREERRHSRSLACPKPPIQKKLPLAPLHDLRLKGIPNKYRGRKQFATIHNETRRLHKLCRCRGTSLPHKTLHFAQALRFASRRLSLHLLHPIWEFHDRNGDALRICYFSGTQSTVARVRLQPVLFS